jgi:ubiquinone/menaquinone biosynthesis C-methylase UbiE
LYQKAYQEMATSGKVSNIDFVGIDISSPPESTLEKSALKLRKLGQENHLHTDFRFVKGSISQPLNFSEGYFDCIISTLTLCSVDDQLNALFEIKRLLRPDGGVFGYVEHTAVLPEEPYRLLEIQQKVFDPLQQAVADNCHLHRYTDSNIMEVFGREGSSVLRSERFMVDGMWPVSCQSCGVIQRIQV